MPLFLGIDGGGTGCRAVVADATGRVLGTGAAGPAKSRPLVQLKGVACSALNASSFKF